MVVIRYIKALASLKLIHSSQPEMLTQGWSTVPIDIKKIDEPKSTKFNWFVIYFVTIMKSLFGRVSIKRFVSCIQILEMFFDKENS